MAEGFLQYISESPYKQTLNICRKLNINYKVFIRLRCPPHEYSPRRTGRRRNDETAQGLEGSVSSSRNRACTDPRSRNSGCCSCMLPRNCRSQARYRYRPRSVEGPYSVWRTAVSRHTVRGPAGGEFALVAAAAPRQ